MSESHIRSLVLATCVFAAMGAAPAAAFCRLTTVKNAAPDASGCIREGVPLAWDRRCFSYTLHQDGSKKIPFEDVERLVATGFAPWTTVTCGGRSLGFEFAETAETTDYDLPYFDTEGGNHNAIIFVQDWAMRDHDPRAFALTTVWHDKTTGRIVDGDMEVNESRGTLGQCAANNDCSVDSGCQTIDLANVVTHEAGHFLGLAHSDVINATMFNSAPVGETCKRSLEEDDTQGICSAYPEGSLPMQCDPTPNGGFGFGGPGSSDGCGCRAGSPGRGWFAVVALVGVLFMRRRGTPRGRARFQR